MATDKTNGQYEVLIPWAEVDLIMPKGLTSIKKSSEPDKDFFKY